MLFLHIKYFFAQFVLIISIKITLLLTEKKNRNSQNINNFTRPTSFVLPMRLFTRATLLKRDSDTLNTDKYVPKKLEKTPNLNTFSAHA